MAELKVGRWNQFLDIISNRCSLQHIISISPVVNPRTTNSYGSTNIPSSIISGNSVLLNIIHCSSCYQTSQFKRNSQHYQRKIITMIKWNYRDMFPRHNVKWSNFHFKTKFTLRKKDNSEIHNVITYHGNSQQGENRKFKHRDYLAACT